MARMAALRHVRPRNRGIIIQIGSALAYRGIPLQSAYCGAKHAIRGFTDSIRSELLHENCDVKLVMVQLPAVNTPQLDWARTHMLYEPRPMPPVIQPEVAARAIFKAARHPRREIWVGLSTAKVILGNLMVPEFLDIYLARIRRSIDRPEACRNFAATICLRRSQTCTVRAGHSAKRPPLRRSG
jgi:short-subunit dehydrogenase